MVQNKLKFIFVLFLGVLTLASCDPAKEFEKEIAQIDSCLVRLDTLEMQYDGIDFDSLSMMVKHVKDNEKLIKALYKPDTLNEELGRQMNDCKAIRKSLDGVEKNEMLYGDELNAVKHQFADLKTDILAGVLKKDQITTYLTTEMDALNKIDVAFSGFYKVQNAEKYRYYVVVPKIDAFIAELKAANETTMD